MLDKNRHQTGHAYRQAGFTFLEVIMAMFMGAMVVTVGFAVNKMVTTNYAAGFQEVQQLDEVGMIVRRWVNELREARDGENGAYPIEVAADNEVIFYSDVDNDQKTERVRYYLDGNNLRRGLVEPTGDPAGYNLAEENVKLVSDKLVAGGEPLLTYYNKDYPGDTVNNPLSLANRLLNTRVIRIHVEVGLSSEFIAKNFNWDSMVQLRNLANKIE